MEEFLLAFLGIFGVVLLLGATFVTLYRRQGKRLAALANRGRPGWADFPGSAARRGFPHRWVMIRSTNTSLLREYLHIRALNMTSWSEALARSSERRFFLSTPVEGWSILVGGSLPDPAQNIDDCYHFLRWLSREFDEVQFFSVDRVLNHHAWARLSEGNVSRAYAWCGDVQWNEGRLTRDERLLGIRTLDYGNQMDSPPYGEVPIEQTNTDRVILLARRWGIDPIAATDILLQQDEMESGEDVSGRGQV